MSKSQGGEVLAPANQANKLSLVAATLVPHTGDFILDIRNNIMEIAIYEDIFSKELKGTILYQDAAGIVETLPLIGEEFVVVSFETQKQDGLKETTEYTFYCYGISKRSRLEDKSEVYVLSLTSPETLINDKLESKKSYVGKTISEIVENEYKINFEDNEWKCGRNNTIRFLGTKEAQPKINIEETEGLHSFVAPSKSPFDFIEYLSSQAYSAKYPESDFVFYRDRDSYNFITFSSLMEKESVESFYYTNPNIALDDEIQSHQIIYGFGYRSLPDTFKRLRTGAYSNEASTLDLVTKKFNTEKFDYYDITQREKFTNISDFPLMSDFSVHKNYFDSSYSLKRFFLTDSDRDDAEYLSNKETDQYILFPNLKEKFATLKTSKNAQIKHSNRLWLSVAGNNSLKVGDIIDVFVPQNAELITLRDKHNLLFTDGDESARFMITALAHNFDRMKDEYITRIECIKDSYGKSFGEIEKYFRNNEGIWT